MSQKNSEPASATALAKLTAGLDPASVQELRAIVEQMEPRGLAPAGNRVLSTRDMARHLGGAASWWERHRGRLVDAGLLVKAQRRFVGDLRAIQQAIADPELWADAA